MNELLEKALWEIYYAGYRACATKNEDFQTEEDARRQFKRYCEKEL